MISLNPWSWLKSFQETSAKVVVDNETMLGSAAIWYAMNTISGDVAKMPLDKMTEGRDGSTMKDRAHPASYLLREAPNEFQTSDVFKEQIQAHALSWGNGRAAIIRDGAGRPVELIPMMPDRTFTGFYDGKKYHFTKPDKHEPLNHSDYKEALVEVMRNGQLEEGWIGMEDKDVLHIPGFGYDGICGMSLAQVAKDSIGCDLRSQKYQDKQLQKGFAGKIMLEAPPNVMKNEDEARQFLAGFRERHSFDGSSETVGMLREGIKANVMQMSNIDAQFIDQRKFSRQDVMLWFGLQHIPGDNSSVSYNSLEQKQLAYLASCLDRWLVRWESQCRAKLLTEQEKRKGVHFFKFNRATWLRTDMQTTANVLSVLVQSKIINRNEARKTIDYNPVEGGDVFENPSIQVNDTPDDSTQARAVVVNRLQELMKVEEKRVADAMEKQNPMQRVEAFYSKWQKTLGDAFEAMGGDREIAVQHCENAVAALVASKEFKSLNCVDGLADSILGVK